MNPEANNDWRLSGQESYIQDKAVRLQKFCVRANHEQWDHEHCIFCWQKIVEDPSKYPIPAEVITEAYTTEDEKHWICPQCFSDFQERFQLKLMK